MNCIKCNEIIENNAKFCTHCGTVQDETDFYEEDASLPDPIPEKKSKKNEKKEKIKKEKEEKASEEYEFEAEKLDKPKTKDRVNFFYLMLSLLCPPYYGVLITIWQSAKNPKASQVYGIATILAFIFMKVKNFVLTVLATIFVVVGALCALFFAAQLILAQFGYYF